jgi:hypothetical protein
MKARKDPRIAKLMRERREELASPEKRVFPEFGTFNCTQQYVEKYYAMNGLVTGSPKDVGTYVGDLFQNLPTEMATL